MAQGSWLTSWPRDTSPATGPGGAPRPTWPWAMYALTQEPRTIKHEAPSMNNRLIHGLIDYWCECEKRFGQLRLEPEPLRTFCWTRNRLGWINSLPKISGCDVHEFLSSQVSEFRLKIFNCAPNLLRTALVYIGLNLSGSKFQNQERAINCHYMTTKSPVHCH